MLRRKISFLINVFSMITSCMVIAVALFVTVLNPTERIEAVILWQIPAVAALLSATTLILSLGQYVKEGGDGGEDCLSLYRGKRGGAWSRVCVRLV